MTKRKILYLPPATMNDILSERAKAILNDMGDVVWNQSDRNYTAEELAALAPGAEVIVTSWGSPNITPEVLAKADKLRIVGHAAGTVKNRMPKEGYDRGIVMLSAAAVIADSVAEYSLWGMLSMQRDLYRHDHHMRRERGWKGAAEGYAHELFFKKVGIVGASMVGRRMIKLLTPFECDIVLYDPYVTEHQAQEMGVRKVTLEELLSTSDIVSVHAPITPETHHMITARHLQSMKDGALFVNSARAWVVDEPALVAELRKRRIRAVLDVYDTEPLPADSPIRDLDNVILTPHVAGFTTETRLRLVERIAMDIQRYLAGQKLQLQVTWERLQTMA